MAEYQYLPEASRLAVNRMTMLSEKEKTHLHRALDAMFEGIVNAIDLDDYLKNVVEDLTPQLGGPLDVNGQKIISVDNGDIDIEPDGTGNVHLGNFTFDADQTVGAGQHNYVLTYDDRTGTI